MSSKTLPILHFNDVYNMTNSTDNKVMRAGKLTRTNFDTVVRFADMINTIRARWTAEAESSGSGGDGEAVEHGLVLFSGDLFSPSVESMLTKGRNMVHLMNELAPDACVPGNHEFDFGRERFDHLTEFCNFNWVLSNVKEYPLKECPNDKDKKAQRDTRDNRLIANVGSNAMDGTLAEAKLNLKADNMKDVCINLSKKLRKPQDQGGEGCDIVFALTHAEHNEDVALGREVCAYPASKKLEKNLEDTEGIDAIFGGHNHNYFLGQGVEPHMSKNLIPKNTEKEDDGLLIVKSGYDFKDLSQVTLELEKRDGACRRYVIKSLKVERLHMANSPSVSDENLRNTKKLPMYKVLHRQYHNEVLKGLEVTVARLREPIEFSSEDPRKYETPIGNWVADMILSAYNDKGMDESKPPLVPTIFMMAGGSIRSNGLPKECKQRDIIALLPFSSPLVALKIKGKAIIDVLEGALSLSGTGSQTPEKTHGAKAPAGPVESDITSSGQWDSTKPSGYNVEERNPSNQSEFRVQEVLVPSEDGSGWKAIDPNGEYCVLTNAYLAEGNIGFDGLKHPLRRSSSDIPMFQALLAYLETSYTMHKIRETFISLGKFVERNGEGEVADMQIDRNDLESLSNLSKQLAEFLKILEVIEASNMVQLGLSLKRAASVLYGMPPDTYTPPLEIKPVDGRMVDISKTKD